MTNIRKSIAYAYPTSTTAEKLGVAATGGWFIQQYRRLESGEWSTPYVAQGNDVFQSADDPELIDLYMETDGEQCWMFTKHGNPGAVLAINIRTQNKWLDDCDQYEQPDAWEDYCIDNAPGANSVLT